jgi:hypothetical protein
MLADPLLFSSAPAFIFTDTISGENDRFLVQYKQRVPAWLIAGHAGPS